MSRSFSYASFVVLFSIGLGACRDREIQSYKAPKDPTPVPMPMAAAGQMPAAPGSMAGQSLPPSDSPTPQVTWAKPEGWTEGAGNQVRVATFSMASSDGRKAELSVTQFPGDVGGDLANVNRWRGQVQLQAVSEADLAAQFVSVEAPAGSFKVIDIVGTETLPDGKSKDRILGAWIKHDGRTWFFKLKGPSDVIETEKAHFNSFVQSIEFK